VDRGPRGEVKLGPKSRGKQHELSYWTSGLSLLQGHEVEVQLLQHLLGVVLQGVVDGQPVAQVGSDVPALQQHPGQGCVQCFRGEIQAMVEQLPYQPAVS